MEWGAYSKSIIPVALATLTRRPSSTRQIPTPHSIVVVRHIGELCATDARLARSVRQKHCARKQRYASGTTVAICVLAGCEIRRLSFAGSATHPVFEVSHVSTPAETSEPILQTYSGRAADRGQP